MPALPGARTALVVAAAAVAAAAYACLRRRRARPTPGPRRDLRGYGLNPPAARWPGGAKLAINFAINIEEGSEPNMPDGDAASTAALCECPSDAPPGVRDLAAESMFEYGARVGAFRVMRAFESRGVPATAFACALALERLPEVAQAVRGGMASGLLDVCCHGYRWEDHIAMEEDVERARIARAVDSLTSTLGEPPSGWYCRTAYDA
jgi:allantoinase